MIFRTTALLLSCLLAGAPVSSEPQRPSRTRVARMSLTLTPAQPLPDQPFRVAIPGAAAAAGSRLVAVEMRGQRIRSIPATAGDVEMTLPVGDYLLAIVRNGGERPLSVSRVRIGETVPAPADPVRADTFTAPVGDWAASLSVTPYPLTFGRTTIVTVDIRATTSRTAPVVRFEAPELLAVAAATGELFVAHRVAQHSESSSGISHIDESDGFKSTHSAPAWHINFPRAGRYVIVANAFVDDQPATIHFLADVR